MEVLKTKLTGKYLVYSDGKVFSFKRTGKFINGSMDKDGYNRIYINGRTVLRHRFVLSTFVSNVENKRTVNHIDGNKLNNSLSNLEWATDSENKQHAWDSGLMENTREALKARDIKRANGKWCC